MIVLGLTGSIASGKTTVARMFGDAGIPVFSADAAVHALYEGEAAEALGRVLPGAVSDGRVDRGRAAAILADDPSLFPAIEAILHPLVREKAAAFIAEQSKAGSHLAVLEIPLLFEGAHDYALDRIAVTVADDAELRRRVLARPGMTQAKLDAILTRQMPQDEKRARADFVIDTSQPLQFVRNRVLEIIETCLNEAEH